METDKKMLMEQITLMKTKLSNCENSDEAFRLKYNILLAEEIINRINKLINYKNYEEENSEG